MPLKTRIAALTDLTALLLAGAPRCRPRADELLRHQRRQREGPTFGGLAGADAIARSSPPPRRGSVAKTWRAILSVPGQPSGRPAQSAGRGIGQGSSNRPALDRHRAAENWAWSRNVSCTRHRPGCSGRNFGRRQHPEAGRFLEVSRSPDRRRSPRWIALGRTRRTPGNAMSAIAARCSSSRAGRTRSAPRDARRRATCQRTLIEAIRNAIEWAAPRHRAARRHRHRRRRAARGDHARHRALPAQARRAGRLRAGASRSALAAARAPSSSSPATWCTVALEPTLVNVAVLGLLVLVRTFLSWTLTVEIESRWPWQARPAQGARRRPRRCLGRTVARAEGGAAARPGPGDVRSGPVLHHHQPGGGVRDRDVIVRAHLLHAARQRTASGQPHQQLDALVPVLTRSGSSISSPNVGSVVRLSMNRRSKSFVDESGALAVELVRQAAGADDDDALVRVPRPDRAPTARPRA